MLKEDAYTLPPLARLYDEMQRSGRSIYDRRVRIPPPVPRPIRNRPRSNKSVPSIRPYHVRRQEFTNPLARRQSAHSFISPTIALANHPGDTASPDDCERCQDADVPPSPLTYKWASERVKSRSPLTDASCASTTD